MRRSTGRRVLCPAHVDAGRRKYALSQIFLSPVWLVMASNSGAYQEDPKETHPDLETRDGDGFGQQGRILKASQGTCSAFRAHNRIGCAKGPAS